MVAIPFRLSPEKKNALLHVTNQASAEQDDIPNVPKSASYM
jgi:hypothetical protein